MSTPQCGHLNYIGSLKNDIWKKTMRQYSLSNSVRQSMSTPSVRNIDWRYSVTASYMTSIYLLPRFSMMVLETDFNSVIVVSLRTAYCPLLGMVIGILFVGNPLL